MADLERASRLRALREERGLGQQALADAQNISLRAYQRQEQTGGIKAENAKALADFYEVDLKWLLHGDTPDLVGSFNGDGDMQAQLDRIERLLKTLAARLGVDPADLEVESLVSLLPGEEAKPSRGQRSPRRAAAKN